METIVLTKQQLFNFAMDIWKDSKSFINPQEMGEEIQKRMESLPKDNPVMELIDKRMSVIDEFSRPDITDYQEGMYDTFEEVKKLIVNQ